MAIGIVDAPDRRELEAGKSFQVREISSIQIDVMQTRGREKGREACRAKRKANEGVRPITSPQPYPADSPNGNSGTHPHTMEPSCSRHRRAPVDATCASASIPSPRRQAGTPPTERSIGFPYIPSCISYCRFRSAPATASARASVDDERPCRSAWRLPAGNVRWSPDRIWSQQKLPVCRPLASQP
jgi:hypothetical protein